MTLRQHLEEIVAERDRVHEGDPFAAHCESMARVTEHADAALAILDDADYREGWADEWVAWVHDPQHPKAPA